jgi:hypothetical protein
MDRRIAHPQASAAAKRLGEGSRTVAMLHWTADRYGPAREVASEIPLSINLKPAGRASSSRAEHARMLEHAAVRRRRAAGLDERDYWRACAPAALVRAARLRGEADFARLP